MTCHASEHLVQPLPFPVVDPGLDPVSGDAPLSAAPMTLRFQGDDGEGGEGESRETGTGHAGPGLQLALDGGRHQVGVDPCSHLQLHQRHFLVVHQQHLRIINKDTNDYDKRSTGLGECLELHRRKFLLYNSKH